MILKTIKSLICLVLIVFCAPIQAVVVSDLYTARIPVSDESDAQRDAAFGRGLSEVLIKVSGDPSVVTGPVVASNVAHAARYVREYSYVSDVGPLPTSKQLLLRVSFDRSAVSKVLRGAGSQIWGSQRPLLAVWIVIKNGPQMQLVANDAAGGMPNDVTQAAKQRGVPVILPLLDIEDLVQVSADDVWNEDIDKLNKVSARYNNDHLVIAKLSKSKNNQWHGHFVLSAKNETNQWDIDAADLKKVLARGINQVVTTVATDYSSPTFHAQQKNQVTLSVKNVRSAEDYAKVSQYLEDLGPISSLQVLRVTPDAVSYKVVLGSTSQALVAALAANPVLQPDGDADDGNTLNYHLPT